MVQCGTINVQGGEEPPDEEPPDEEPPDEEPNGDGNFIDNLTDEQKFMAGVVILAIVYNLYTRI